jgi:hypothetical protein
MQTKSTVTLTGVPEVLRQLEIFMPDAVKEMKKEVKGIVGPALSKIDSNIPVVSPLRGMIHNGRTQYGGAKAGLAFPITKIIYNADVHPLVQIQVKSPKGAAGLLVADMAGRGSGKGRRASTMSAEITKEGVAAYRYRKNGQGQAMIRALSRKASRFVYPGVERSIPSMSLKTLAVLERYAAKVNRTIERI